MNTDNLSISAISEGSEFPHLDLVALVSGVWGHEHARLATDAYVGQWKVLMYWPLEYLWSCVNEIRTFSARRQEFFAHDAVLIGAAPETRSLLHSWRSGHGLAGALPFPIISDDNRKLARALVGRTPGSSMTVIIDPEDVVRHVSTVEGKSCRTVDSVLWTLKELQLESAQHRAPSEYVESISA